MKQYVIVAVILFGGLGLGWFLLNGDAIPDQPLITDSNTADLTLPGAEDAMVVTADPVATVNGVAISQADFTAQQSQLLSEQGVDPAALDVETLAAVQNQILDSLISQKLLQQAASSAGVVVSEAEIDTQINVIKGQFTDDAMYEQALASEGLTESELRTSLSADLSVEPYLEQELALNSLTVTEEEISQVYGELAVQQELPPLEQVRGDVERFVMQRKQQPLIAQHIASLRAAADIEVFI